MIKMNLIVFYSMLSDMSWIFPPYAWSRSLMFPLSMKQLMFLYRKAHSSHVYLIFCFTHSPPLWVHLPPFYLFPSRSPFSFSGTLSPPPSLLPSPPPSYPAASLPLPCCCRLYSTVICCSFCLWNPGAFEVAEWKEEVWRWKDRGGKGREETRDDSSPYSAVDRHCFARAMESSGFFGSDAFFFSQGQKGNYGVLRDPLHVR